MRNFLGIIVILAAVPLLIHADSPVAVIYQTETRDGVYSEREARRLGDDVDVYYDREASRRRAPDPRGNDYEPSKFLQEEPLHQDTLDQDDYEPSGFLQEEPLHQDTMDRDDYEPSKFLQEEALHPDTMDRDDYEPSKFLQEEPLHQDYLGE